ncbi:GlcNAc transferase [Dictyostelium discoideum AX4]|uniref:alpha-1,3-mannosyl-glycoprotein 2-beta-N-acetylglucosaminyltransferase n=1 Tax=Dictyostelium discoideum TaxID=44689 RepID=Q55EK3_DICDI|nr:GlcNAc transferase [Dictyostelium discoideum AX4]EAL73016.1 GlcNAc transferase [Dictyostelium discoideum AX4]|eukprot:XP_647017.1 GlcNAc transferase [Dictyostelium discoideum AX4]
MIIDSKNLITNKKRLIFGAVFILLIFYFIFSSDEENFRERSQRGVGGVVGGNNNNKGQQPQQQQQQQRAEWSDSQLTKTIKENMKLNNATIESDLYKVKWLDEIRPDNERVRKFRIKKNSDITANLDRLYDHPPIAIVTSNKPKHLDRLLANLINNCNANIDRIKVFNDGKSVQNILSKYNVTKEYRISKKSQEGSNSNQVLSNEEKQYYMNSHYKEIFSFMFNNETSDKVIFLEEDLIMSPDSLEYFNHLSKLMNYDPSIFGISAWNDNGFKWNVEQSRSNFENKFSFLRQDHFGGLGFLISREIYKKRIEPNWQIESTTPWDVIVQQSMRSGDSCIFPEIPRSQHAPLLERNYDSIFKDQPEKDGWGNYNFYLPKITTIHTYHMNLSKYLSPEYDLQVKKRIMRATEVDTLNSIPMMFSTSNRFVYYVPAKSNDDPRWDAVIDKLQMVGRGNGGAVRGIYKGVIETTFFGKRVYLVGTYSPFYSQQQRNKSQRILFNDFPKEEFDPTITNPLTSTMLFRTDKDLSLDITLAEKVFSCKDFCEKHKVSCLESDMMLLTDSTIVLLQLEQHCSQVNYIPSNNTDTFYPIKDKDGICWTTNQYSKLSCTSKPPKKSEASRICICKDKSF